MSMTDDHSPPNTRTKEPLPLILHGQCDCKAKKGLGMSRPPLVISQRPLEHRSRHKGCDGWGTSAPSMLPHRPVLPASRYHSIVSRSPSSHDTCSV
jgi:hypothetical protein